MSIKEKFCWDRINDEQFEELVFTVLKSANPQEIKWRKGPGDKGRDIQVTFRRQAPLGDEVNETYFVEVKHRFAQCFERFIDMGIKRKTTGYANCRFKSYNYILS